MLEIPMASAQAIILLISVHCVCCLVSFRQQEVNLPLISSGILSGGVFFLLINAAYPSQLLGNAIAALGLAGAAFWTARKRA